MGGRLAAWEGWAATEEVWAAAAGAWVATREGVRAMAGAGGEGSAWAV